jgi:hypothetical protein
MGLLLIMLGSGKRLETGFMAWYCRAALGETTAATATGCSQDGERQSDAAQAAAERRSTPRRRGASGGYGATREGLTGAVEQAEQRVRRRLQRLAHLVA